MNLISKYLIYTKDHEAQEIYHKWCMISAVASILSGRCWTTLGFSNLNPNFFVIIAGPPAAPRKGEAIKAIMRVVEPVIDEGGIILSSESITARRLMNELVESEMSCHIGDEKREYMSLLTVAFELTSFLKPRDYDLSVLLLELFDGKAKHRHGTSSCGEASMKNVSLNILAATTHEFFEGQGFEDHVRSGLSSRCIFLYVESRRWNNPDPVIDLKLEREIQLDLLKLINITGCIPFSKSGKEFFNKWYGKQPLVIDKDTPRNMVSYCGRRQTYVRKLALILWAMDYSQEKFIKEITTKHVEEALELVTEAEEYMAVAYGKSGRSSEAFDYTEIIAYFDLRPNTWVTKQELVHKFLKDIKLETLDSILYTLCGVMQVLKMEIKFGKTCYMWVGLKGNV